MIRKLALIVLCGLVHTSTCTRIRFEQPMQDPFFRNDMQFGNPGMPGDPAFKREHILPGQFDPMRNQFFGNEEMQPQPGVMPNGELFRPQQVMPNGELFRPQQVMPNGEFFRPQQQVMPNEQFLRREPLMQREMMKRNQMMRPEMLRNLQNPTNGFAVMLTPCQCTHEPQNFPPMTPQAPQQNFPPVVPQNFPQPGFQPMGPQNFPPLGAPAFQPLSPQPFQPLPASPLGPLTPQGFSPMAPQETFLPIQPSMPGAPLITPRMMLPKPMMKPHVCQHMMDLPSMPRLVRQSCSPFSNNMQMPQPLNHNNQEYNNEPSPFQGNFPSQTPPQEETSEQSPNTPATPRTPSVPSPLNLAQMSSIC